MECMDGVRGLFIELRCLFQGVMRTRFHKRSAVVAAEAK